MSVRLAACDREWVELIEAAKRQAARSASSYLFTTHGTVLFVDAATGELRHGPPGTSPANAVLRREGMKGRLMHDTGEGFRPILRQPDGQKLVSAPGDVDSDPPLEIVDAGPGLAALKEGGSFLSSEPEGGVTQYRPACKWWEHFRLSPGFDRKALAANPPGQSGAHGGAQAPPFYLLAWGYTPLKGGVVAMHLLCHYLNLIGHEAYLVPDPFPTEGFVTQPGLRTPVLTTEIAKAHEAARRDPIAVYAEGGLHNKLICRRVIRYMMNMPGARGGNEAAAIAFWADPARRSDFVLRFYDAYLLPNVPSRVLHVPIVDQTVFRMPLEERPREGFLVYSHRVAVTDEMIPHWAQPFTTISMSNPRMPEELAPLYQRARGLVVFEGTGSVLDAQMCGCPVVGIPNEQFRRNESSGHFGNAGFGWGTDIAELEWAERTLGIFQRNYRAHVQAFPSELAACIQEALAFFDQGS